MDAVTPIRPAVDRDIRKPGPGHRVDDRPLEKHPQFECAAGAAVENQVPTEFMLLGADVVVTTQALSSRRTTPDGKIGKGTFVVTYVWRELPQGWRIVYGHESWSR